MDIHDWWNRTRRPDGALKLSSRRLLLFLKHLDEDSNFKNNYREDWCDDKYIRVAILNELRILRSDQVVLHDRDPIEPILMKSPRQQVADQLDSKQKSDIRTGIMAQLLGKT